MTASDTPMGTVIMGTIVFLVVLLVGTAVALLIRRQSAHLGLGRVMLATAIGFTTLFVCTLIFSSFAIVQAKEVGVLTTFGKPSERKLGAGLSFKAPWQKVTHIDGTIQTDKYRGDDCIYVRIGDGSRSCLTLTHRWQIVPERADETFANFRSNDPTESLRDAVVSTQLVSVAQDVLSEYNPISDLQVVDADNANASLDFAPDYDQIAQDISDGMELRYGTEPLVKTVAITVSYLSLSNSTQSKIDAFIAEVANTRIAVQRRQTAQAEAAANRELSESVTNAPNVLVSKCLDIMAEGEKIGYQFPAGFSCWPGDNGSVVIPSAR
jgi:regulator of protease activity HflC (stomatin/prohibitin superfamily)